MPGLVLLNEQDEFDFLITLFNGELNEQTDSKFKFVLIFTTHSNTNSTVEEV